MAGLGAGVTGPRGRGCVGASCARPASGLPTAAAPASVAPLSKPRLLKGGVTLWLDIISSRLLLLLQHERTNIPKPRHGETKHDRFPGNRKPPSLAFRPPE